MARVRLPSELNSPMSVKFINNYFTELEEKNSNYRPLSYDDLRLRADKLPRPAPPAATAGTKIDYHGTVPAAGARELQPVNTDTNDWKVAARTSLEPMDIDENEASSNQKMNVPGPSTEEAEAAAAVASWSSTIQTNTSTVPLEMV